MTLAYFLWLSKILFYTYNIPLAHIWCVYIYMHMCTTYSLSIRRLVDIRFLTHQTSLFLIGWYYNTNSLTIKIPFLELLCNYPVIFLEISYWERCETFCWEIGYVLKTLVTCCQGEEYHTLSHHTPPISFHGEKIRILAGLVLSIYRTVRARPATRHPRFTHTFVTSPLSSRQELDFSSTFSVLDTKPQVFRFHLPLFVFAFLFWTHN